jgi:hypothetical protein
MAYQSNPNPLWDTGGTPFLMTAIETVRLGRIRRLPSHKTPENSGKLEKRERLDSSDFFLYYLGVEVVAGSNPASPTGRGCKRYAGLRSPFVLVRTQECRHVSLRFLVAIWLRHPPV